MAIMRLIRFIKILIIKDKIELQKLYEKLIYHCMDGYKRIVITATK